MPLKNLFLFVSLYQIHAIIFNNETELWFRTTQSALEIKKNETDKLVWISGDSEVVNMLPFLFVPNILFQPPLGCSFTTT